RSEGFCFGVRRCFLLRRFCFSLFGFALGLLGIWSAAVLCSAALVSRCLVLLLAVRTPAKQEKPKRRSKAPPHSKPNPKQQKPKQRSAPARRHMLCQPREHFLVPVFAVLRLEHPVPLVREVEELRRDFQPLQGGKELVPLADRHPEIQVV